MSLRVEAVVAQICATSSQDVERSRELHAVWQKLQLEGARIWARSHGLTRVQKVPPNQIGQVMRPPVSSAPGVGVDHAHWFGRNGKPCVLVSFTYPEFNEFAIWREVQSVGCKTMLLPSCMNFYNPRQTLMRLFWDPTVFSPEINK
ncbi:hypothetical protein FZ983_16600 [Azospirillum sp. B21]|uniref:hypothetical protein n=1 Tax=Azospirillum sp. B21 TaxID=2607496 RepID=UPI0011EF9665|nr:hypothetical protein [Azospirillum sp. B21]KAA0578951.1 hypothetical protein FZ983_16600 [Azospirillum sp. B21]